MTEKMARQEDDRLGLRRCLMPDIDEFRLIGSGPHDSAHVSVNHIDNSPGREEPIAPKRQAVEQIPAALMLPRAGEKCNVFLLEK